jgi:hypothetical protein
VKTLLIKRGGVSVSAVARCTDCHRTSDRLPLDEARTWARQHECTHLTDTEAADLLAAGAALAYTARDGWHLIPLSTYFAAAAQALLEAV